jgi:hypothetical protein
MVVVGVMIMTIMIMMMTMMFSRRFYEDQSLVEYGPVSTGNLLPTLRSSSSEKTT